MTSSEPASASKGPRYAPPDPTLPKPWRALIDGNTGYLYFWNPETKVTQYKRPVAAAPPSPPQPPSYSRPEERTSNSAPSESCCFQVMLSAPMPEDPNLKGKTVAEETVAPSIAAKIEHSGCPSNFYMSIGDDEVIEEADDPDAILDEDPEASTAYAPDAAPHQTCHAVKKVSATRVHKDASQKARTTKVVNPVEDHIPSDTEVVNLRKRKPSKSLRAVPKASTAYAPDAAPRRTRHTVKKVSATWVHKDASQKLRTTQVVNPVEDHIPSDMEVVNLHKRKRSKSSRAVPEASTAYIPDAAPRRTRHTVKKVSVTRVHKDASQKARTTRVVNPVEDHIPSDTGVVNLRKRKLSMSSRTGPEASTAYAPDAAPRRTCHTVKKVSATRVHKDASQKETARTIHVVNPVEDHVPSNTEVVNLRKRKLSKSSSAGTTQSGSVPQKPSGASGLPPRKGFAKKRKTFAQSSIDEPTTAKDAEGTTRQEKLSAGNQLGEVPKQPTGTITEQTTREDDDRVLDDSGFVPDTGTCPPSPKETAGLGGENPKASMAEPGDSSAVDKISTKIAAIEQSALLDTSSSLQVKKYVDKQLVEPVPKTAMELPGPIQDILRIYDRVTELEKQLAKANTRDKERKELMVRLSKSFNEQNRQYEQVVKERDDAVAESLRLKGQLETQKTAYEVISKDLDISYKLLAGAQSLFAKYQNQAWEPRFST